MSGPAATPESSSLEHPTGGVEERADFDFVRYANCWEDAHVLCEALAPLEGARVISIASGGCNSFALAAEGAHVVAADLSFAQLACVELRRAAFRRLDHPGVLRFFGVHADPDRLGTFARLAADLPPRTRAFWEANPALVAGGIIHCGKFERYFQLFRRWVLPLIHRRRTIARLLEEKTREERHRFYEERWNTRRWRLVFRMFFGRFAMGRLGRDPEFFRYVEGSVADRILKRARHALTELPTHQNPYLEYIIRGNYGSSLPRYLQPERFEAVRAGLDRIVLHEGPVEEAAQVHDPGGGFDRFNLSDIFEYVDAETGHRIYRDLVEPARPGARFAYWHMLVPRSSPPDLAPRLKHLEELSRRLFLQDLAFFYSAFVVEELLP
jgi:S-adenosylmethionine-diacylglycerol 3-amino-3-carboxypropyl transferase